MRLDTSGNLGLGVTPSAWNTSYKVIEIGNVFSLMGTNSAADLYGNLFLNTSSQFIYKTTAAATAYSIAGGQHRWYVVASGTAGNVASFPSANMTLGNNGNLLLGSTSDSGEKLQVTGTAKITGAVTGASFIPSVGSAVTNGMYLNNTNSLAFSTNSTFRLVIGSTGIVGIGIPNPSLGYGDGIGVELSPVGYIQSYRSQAVSATFGRHTSTGLIQTFFYGATAGTAAQIGAIGTDGDGLTFSGGAFGTTHLTLTSGGNFAVDTNTLFVDATNNRVGIGTITPDTTFRVAGTVNSTQAIFGNVDGRGLAISTSVISGTNEAGVIFNARSSVSSGTLIFQTDGTQRVQIDSTGLIINGGNALEFINSAANAVSAIRPTGGGTSVMSTNSNGLHIAVGTEAAGDLILASNNTERIRLSSSGWFSHTTATNPSSSVTDSYVQYSADVTAGNAAPHFRTENGAVIKLYQETTAVGNSIISLGGGNSVLDDTTFDGYTLRQIVKALRNQGILA
jgi:hypothetical protein